MKSYLRLESFFLPILLDGVLDFFSVAFIWLQLGNFGPRACCTSNCLDPIRVRDPSSQMSYSTTYKHCIPIGNNELRNNLGWFTPTYKTTRVITYAHKAQLPHDQVIFILKATAHAAIVKMFFTWSVSCLLLYE